MTANRKTILIAGSTDGVGRYVAERLAAQGWRAIIHGRDRSRGEAVVEESPSKGARRASSPPTFPRSPRFVLLLQRCGATATASMRSSTTPGSARAARGANSAPMASNCASRSIVSRGLPADASSHARAHEPQIRAHRQRRLRGTTADRLFRRDAAHGYSGVRAYCQSKLAQIMFTWISPRSSRNETSRSTACILRPTWTRPWFA